MKALKKRTRGNALVQHREIKMEFNAAKEERTNVKKMASQEDVVLVKAGLKSCISAAESRNQRRFM